MAITESQFDQQLRTITRYYQPISPQQALDSLHGAPLPPRPILVTFDDGYRNNLIRAVPILERHGVGAIFHVSIGYIGRDDLLWPDEVNERVLRWPRTSLPLPDGDTSIDMPTEQHARADVADRILEACKRIPDAVRHRYLDALREVPIQAPAEDLSDLYRCLSWDDVRELDRRGFAIGSHTVTHPILTQTSDDTLRRELRESKRTIEQEVGKPCHWIAYPNGSRADFSPSVTAAAVATGYEGAFTLLGGSNRFPIPSIEIDRICVVRDLTPDAFQARLSGLATLYHRFRN